MLCIIYPSRRKIEKIILKNILVISEVLIAWAMSLKKHSQKKPGGLG